MSAARVQIGIAGWSYPDWDGPVYPRTRGRSFHPLAFLAPYVDVVEVNSTFYAVPTVAHVARWARIAEQHPHLAFTAKLHRDVTHAPWNATSPTLLAASVAALAPLRDGGRLVALLAQFPLSFVASDRARRHLEALVGGLDGYPVVVEVRHRSWADPRARAALARLPVSVAHLDWPASPEHVADSPSESLPQVGPLGYLRLHGRNVAAWSNPTAGRDAKYDHRYAPHEVEQIAERTRRIAAACERTLVVANNHYGGKALAVSLELRWLLTGVPARAPETLAAAFPDLSEKLDVVGQRRLFST